MRLRTCNNRRRQKELAHIPLYYRNYPLWAKYKGEELMARHGDSIRRFEAGDRSGMVELTGLSDEELIAYLSDSSGDA